MLSRVMQADMLIWPLFCNGDEVRKTWAFRKEFGVGEPDATFTPYWENRLLTANSENVVVGYYRRGDRALVIVSNLNRHDEAVELACKGINVTSLKNAETGEAIPVNGGKVSLKLKRNDYVALRVNY